MWCGFISMDNKNSYLMVEKKQQHFTSARITRGTLVISKSFTFLLPRGLLFISDTFLGSNFLFVLCFFSQYPSPICITISLSAALKNLLLALLFLMMIASGSCLGCVVWNSSHGQQMMV